MTATLQRVPTPASGEELAPANRAGESRERRGLPCVVGTTVLAAAALKSWGFDLLPLAHGSPALAAIGPASLIAWETFLGLWLLSGTLPTAARRVAIGCFGVFACYTFYEALAGKADCGCFGQVHVNPWLTFILDVSIVLALTFLRKPDARKVPPSRWAQRKWPVAAAAAIGLLVGATVAMLHPKVVAAANGLASADNGRIVILEPHQWLHHRLPVLKHIVSQRSNRSLGRQLATGNWVIMFYHASCEECRHTIPIYENLARQNAASGTDTHVAFIRVPPDLTGLGAATGSGTAGPQIFHASPALHGNLDNSHQWFATTPAVMQLRDGTVLRAATGSRAMNLKWLGTTVTGQGPGIKEQWPEYKDDGVSDGRSS